MNAVTLTALHPGRASIHAALPSGRYGDRRGINWVAILLILGAHALLLVALVTLDVIPLHRPPPEPMVMTLIPESAPPPPAAPPPAETVPDKPPVAIAVPEAVVRVPTPAPAVAVTQTPAPPAPVVSAAPAAPAAVSAVAAPITPPSANAATLHNPSPRYPIEARRKRQEGTVRLRVVITTEGRVKDISVARSSGYESLDDAALDAVRRWKFVPGTQSGQPVEAVGYVPIPFRLT